MLPDHQPSLQAFPFPAEVCNSVSTILVPLTSKNSLRTNTVSTLSEHVSPTLTYLY